MRSPFLAICLEHLVFIIGKALTLLHLMTILYTRWRFLLLIVSSKDEFCSEKES